MHEHEGEENLIKKLHPDSTEVTTRPVGLYMYADCKTVRSQRWPAVLDQDVATQALGR